jgi:hypothetical protein
MTPHGSPTPRQVPAFAVRYHPDSYCFFWYVAPPLRTRRRKERKMMEKGPKKGMS